MHKCILFAVIVLSFPSCSKRSGPNIVCVEPKYDAGAVHVSNGTSVLEHTFLIQNRGDRPLELISAKASCSCISVELAGPIAPGKSIPLKVYFSVTASQSEKKSVEILLLTNDQVKPVFKLSFAAAAKESAYTSPYTIDFGDVAVGTTKKATLYVVDRNSHLRHQFIRSVSENLPAGIAVEKINQYRETIYNQGNVPGFLFYAVLVLKIDGNKIDNSRNSILAVTLSSGEVLNVPIRWRVVDKPMGFPVDIYTFRPSSGESTSTAKIAYQHHVGELIRDVSISGDGFSVKNVQKFSGAVSIEVECLFSQEKEQRGFLTVYSNKGSESLPLLAQHVTTSP